VEVVRVEVVRVEVVGVEVVGVGVCLRCGLSSRIGASAAGAAGAPPAWRVWAFRARCARFFALPCPLWGRAIVQPTAETLQPMTKSIAICCMRTFIPAIFIFILFDEKYY